MFVAKRARPDIYQVALVLSARVKENNDTDWKKLVIIIAYFIGLNKNYLTLSSGDLKVIKWYVDASFAVHPGFKSHTGEIITMG